MLGSTTTFGSPWLEMLDYIYDLALWRVRQEVRSSRLQWVVFVIPYEHATEEENTIKLHIWKD